MRLRQRLFVGFCLTAFAMAAGCKASKEDVQKAWNENASKVESYGKKYPQFAAILKKSHKEQKPVFDKAAKGKGDDAVKGMQTANKALKQVVGPIDTYESRVARINKLKSDRAVHKNKGHKVRSAIAKANKKLAQAAEVIANAKPADKAEYVKAMGQANDYLNEGLQPLERLKKKGSKGKKRKKRKKKRR
jgi:hypothetical protein